MAKKKEVRDLYNLEVSAPECMDFLRLSERTFFREAEQGIIAKKAGGVYILGEAAESYYKNKYGSSLGAAKLRIALAEAELKELELAKRREEVLSVADVRKARRDLIINAKNKLLAIPGKTAPELTGRNTREIEGILKREIYAALTELGEIGDLGGEE